ncbi:23S rRNA (uracil747-C5)-methyltransferase [Arcanobacterium pluranimalium]|uniref:methyltransferase domain-containing protein n=1 Tax=Arcanobacterium pluranimalium TaxID=108028 RepID=UPI00195BBE4E|nr:methyltransferase domain-containing protein [Arcanobacterium pluranimalium]MBM7824494.1 23S rRNA (uracil747-C5)-methyltransferase [Arcanobacterium pluranimalium]
MAEPIIDCEYFAKDLCRSCARLDMPYDEQLATKFEGVRALIDAKTWLPSLASKPESFRNKVKLVVSGTIDRPQLGITDVDLRDCPLPTTGIRIATAQLAEFIRECAIQPYNPATDRGVLKYVIVTESTTGQLMVRFVARRRGVQGILFKKYERLCELVPMLAVCTLNVQPERKAIIEGEEEILISEQRSLPMPIVVSDPAQEMSAGVQRLHLELRPQSFFQTNTEMAEALYARAAHWAQGAESAWDLYCGVGGFALALAQAGVKNVVGVEVSPDAVAAGNEQAAKYFPDVVSFVAGDATAWVREQTTTPQVVVVNPPRRGIGAELAQWLEQSEVPTVIYSSCNARSLAADLEKMPSYSVEQAQMLDMFPHTDHSETIALLKR